jgi:hypothetical protein
MKTENVLQQAPVSNERVLAVPGKEKEQRRRAVNLQYTFRGSTAHFNVYYYTDGGATAQSMADAVLGACERDYSNLVDCFGLTPNFLPFQIYVDPGSAGGMHAHCYVTLIHLDDFDGVSPDIVNFENVCEVSEVFMANQGIGWDCGWSNGEGLSRVLAAEAYPNGTFSFTTAAVWLDSSNRPDWVTNNEPTDGDYIANGCSTLFLNYLHYQLDFSWKSIVQAGAATLAQTYTKLTGRADAFAPFAAVLQQQFPPGKPSGLSNDNPFPVAQQLQLVGITLDGNVWRTVRFSDSSWASPFEGVKEQAGDPGQFVALASAGVNLEFQIVGVTADGGMWHTIQHVDGSWQLFADVKGQAGNSGHFAAVACARQDGVLRVCGVTADGGMWHTTRNVDGSWQPFGNVKSQAGDPGSFVAVACTCANGFLHVCGVIGGNIKIWFATCAPDGVWSQFEGVTLLEAGTLTPYPTSVSCAATIDSTGFGENPYLVHVCAATSNYRMWHAIRDATGSWTPFTDFTAPAGAPTELFNAVGCARVNDELQVSGVTTVGGILQTKRFSDGSWQMFKDVKIQSGDPGRFTEVSCGGVEPATELQELRNKVRNLAFAIWVGEVRGGGSYFGHALYDWVTARNELGIPPDLFL